MNKIVLRLNCPKKMSASTLTTWLAALKCENAEIEERNDPSSGRHLLRIVAHSRVDTEKSRMTIENLTAKSGIQWNVGDLGIKPRLLIMVSRQLHCLVDLLEQMKAGKINGEVAAIVSNHLEGRRLRPAKT